MCVECERGDNGAADAWHDYKEAELKQMKAQQIIGEVAMMIRQYNELTGDTLENHGLCLMGAGVHQDFKNLELMHSYLNGAVSLLERQAHGKEVE